MENIQQKVILSLFLIVSTSIVSATGSLHMTDSEISESIIKESISSYPGNCPCPYSTARNGSRCGKRSTYSRPGGYSPICYKSDVSKKMIENYKKKSKKLNTNTKEYKKEIDDYKSKDNSSPSNQDSPKKIKKHTDSPRNYK